MGRTATRYVSAVTQTVAGQLEQNGTASIHITGDSMVPMLRPGDILTIRKEPLNKLNSGDILVLDSGGAMIAHRLLRKHWSPNGVLLVTKGDRQVREDDPWDATLYVGRAHTVSGQRGRFNLDSPRWRAVNRVYGAMVSIEWALFARLAGVRDSVGKPGFPSRWLLRAFRLPSKTVLALGLTGPRISVTASQQRRAFLYACLREDHPAIEEFCSFVGLDDQAWSEVLAEEERCQVLPLLHNSLRHHRERVPGWVTEKVAQAHLRSLGHNLTLVQGLQVVLKAFVTANIPVMLLKGAAMLGGPEAIEAGRPTSDLDLLVRERDRSRAAAALRGIGYRPFEPGSVKNHEGLEGQTTNWVDAHSRTVVDLHTHLLHLSIPLTIDMDQVWKEAETMTVGGEQALILSSEMRLLHTALHASWTHTYSFGMRWLYDIALILKATEGRLDWQRFLKISSKWRAAGAAYWPLKLAQDLMFVDVPARVLKSIRPLGPVPGGPGGCSRGSAPYRAGHGRTRATTDWPRSSTGTL